LELGGEPLGKSLRREDEKVNLNNNSKNIKYSLPVLND